MEETMIRLETSLDKQLAENGVVIKRLSVDDISEIKESVRKIMAIVMPQIIRRAIRECAREKIADMESELLTFYLDDSALG